MNKKRDSIDALYNSNGSLRDCKRNKLDLYTTLVSLFISLSLYGYQLTTTIFWRLGEENSRIVTVPFRGLILLISMIIIFLSLKKKREKKISLFFKIYIIYVIIYCIKILIDLQMYPLKAGNLYEIAFNYSLLIILPSIITLTCAIDNCNITQTYKYTKVIIYLSIVFGAFSVRSLYSIKEGARISLGDNLILNAISLGHLGATGIIICLIDNETVSVFRLKVSSLLQKLIILPLSTIMILYSASRGPIVSLLFVILIYCLSSFKKAISAFLIVVLGIVCIQGVVDISKISEIAPVLYNRILFTMESGDDMRGYLIKKAIEEFWKHPFGVGYFMIPYEYYSHNLFVDCLMTWGILGLIFLLIITTRACVNSLLYLRRYNNIYFSFFALLFFQRLVGSMFSGSFFTDFPMTLLYAIMLYYTPKNPIYNVCNDAQV